MDKPECSICDNIFDSNEYRPRALPCGHGFCSMCIETAIKRGDKTCAICRKHHGANSSNDLPVSFLLEDFAHKLAESESQKHVLELVHEGNYGICPKHKEIPLYFKCKSHRIKVCHSCAVLDHPPTVCQLISFEDEIKETKSLQIETFKKQNQIIMDFERDLYNLHQTNMGEIDFLVAKSEQINQEIKEKRESQEQIRDAIKVCQQKQKSFTEMENKLSATTSSQDIAIQCDIGKIQVSKSQKWEETLGKELNIKQLYAQVERSGILRSSRAFGENGRIFIHRLSREIKPPSSATLLNEAMLGLNISPVSVFLDISESGNILGRVIISAFMHTYHGQYFIEKVLGFDGLSIKGTNFFKRNYHYVQLEDCITEDGSKENISFSQSIDNNHQRKRPSRGMIFPEGSSFIIWKNEGGRGENCKWPSQCGTIDSGMNVIDIIASKQYGVTEIVISDCGIVLHS